MKRPRTAAMSPLDIVLLHFPEVRQGTIIGRCGVSGQSGGIIWYLRMPDASYCKVQIGLNQKPSKTPLDPDLADHLEAVWQGMGDAALMAALIAASNRIQPPEPLLLIIPRFSILEMELVESVPRWLIT